MNNDLLKKLCLPFHPSVVYWKPGMVSQDSKKALAMPYADLRAYQNRLDEVCGLDWAVTYTPWAGRLICHLTIGGITRSSTGEPDGQAERSEIAGTAAEAQAFKRACSMFSLGRYLYYLPTLWVDYDATTKHFTDTAKAKLTGIIAQHYKRATADAAQANQPGNPDPGGDGADEQAGASPDEVRPALQRFEDKGRATFRADWSASGEAAAARVWLLARYTAHATPDNIRTDLAKLTDQELDAITSGLTTNGHDYRRAWYKQRAAAAKNKQAK